MKTIRPRAIDVRELRLSAEEGFVLSRVDGSTTVRELVALTGLDEARVVSIVDHLAEAGALEVDAALAPPARPSSQLRAASPTASAPVLRGQTAPPIDEDPTDAALRAFLAGDDPLPDSERAPPIDVGEPHVDEADEADALAKAETDAVETDAVVETDADTAAENEAEDEVLRREQIGEREYRRIYQTVYHPMPKDLRTKEASEVKGADLIALCLDPDPQIIHAVLTNPRAGLDHARMIALHHRTQIGLEAVAKRVDYLKDATVQRRLLRNPQLPTTILNRMVVPKLMMEIYKIAIDREIPERTRVMTREILRKKFTLASSDEKASLLFKTEGRCLVLLVSCSLDAHATQIMCSKNNYTLLFVQNLARWSATPPPILAHLLKLPIVRRNVGIKKMLLKHPNMPSEAKRNA